MSLPEVAFSFRNASRLHFFPLSVAPRNFTAPCEGVHKGYPPCGCPLPRSPSEGLEGSSCRHSCPAEGHTDLSLSPRHAAAALSTKNQSSASRESSYQIKSIIYSRAELLLFHFIHDFTDVPGNAKGLLFPTAKVPVHDGGRNMSPTLPLVGARSAWSHSAPAAPQLEKAAASWAYSGRATRGKGNHTEERRGESAGECMESNHFTSSCKLETRYG